MYRAAFIIRYAFAFSVLACINFAVVAQPQDFVIAPEEISGEHITSAPLNQHLSFFRDSTKSLNFFDIQERLTDFVPITNRSDLHFGYTRDRIWLHTQIHNQSGVEQQRLLEFEYAFLDQVTVFVLRGNDIETMRSGNVLPVNDRVLANRQPIFPIELAPNERIQVFALIDSEGSIALDVNLVAPESFFPANDYRNFWLSAYLGMLLALGLYNLLLSIGLREKVFLLYALFVSSFSIGIVTMNGLGTMLFWGQLGFDGNRIMIFGFTLSAFFGTWFARDFLDTRIHSPKWHKAFNLWLCLVPFAVIGAWLLPRSFALYVMDINGLITALLIVSCSVYCAIKGVPGARLFVIAWGIFLTGVTLFALRNLGLVPSNFFTLYGIQIGSAFEMLLLSIALAARFNKLKRQKERAQAAMLHAMQRQEALLEAKVAARTAELGIMATTDMLTGLLNRNGLNQKLEEALQRSRRNNSSITMLMLDLDEFKPINDEHGHEVGDFVLKQIAERIRSHARGNEVCARFGGDEFIIIAENYNATIDEEAFSNRLREAIREPIIIPNGKSVSIDVSIGYYTTDEATNINQLLREADEAMYSAKRAKFANEQAGN